VRAVLRARRKRWKSATESDIEAGQGLERIDAEAKTNARSSATGAPASGGYVQLWELIGNCGVVRMFRSLFSSRQRYWTDCRVVRFNSFDLKLASTKY
jgi:hypothetical protein